MRVKFKNPYVYSLLVVGMGVNGVKISQNVKEELEKELSQFNNVKLSIYSWGVELELPIPTGDVEGVEILLNGNIEANYINESIRLKIYYDAYLAMGGIWIIYREYISKYEIQPVRPEVRIKEKTLTITFHKIGKNTEITHEKEKRYW